MSGEHPTSTAWARAAFAAIVLLLSLAAPVAASPLEDAYAAGRSGDIATALRLVRPLADQGVADAQSYLGDRYYSGDGVPLDYAEALKWYRRAADQGNASAQCNIGFMYVRGRSVPQDYAEALKWFRRAADQDYASAQHYLGLMYSYGNGVPQDYVLAHMWFNLSAARGDQLSPVRRDDVAKLLTPAQIAEAQKLAREWQHKRP